jgi:hypothetical protein
MSTHKSDERPTPDTVERWTYVGRRELQRGGLGVLYLDPNGAECLYRLRGKMRHRSIGATYDVTVDRDAEGNLLGAFVASGRFVEEADADDERLAGWAADDRAAYTADTARRREERAKADAAEAFGDLTLSELRVRMHRLPRPQRTALLANVLAELGA